MNTSSVQSMLLSHYASQNQSKRKQAMASMASGKRLTHAAVDPAAMAVAAGLGSRAASHDQARANLGDAMSVLDVAEGGMSSMQDLGKRARELAVQGASDTIGESGRKAIKQELQSIEEEMARLGATTRWGDDSLLDGSRGPMDIQAGPDADDAITLDIGDVTPDGTAADGIDVTSGDDFRAYMADVEDRLDSLSEARAKVGSNHNRFSSAYVLNEVQANNARAADSRMSDADYAAESVEAATSAIQSQVNLTMMRRANDNLGAMTSLIA